MNPVVELYAERFILHDDERKRSERCGDTDEAISRYFDAQKAVTDALQVGITLHELFAAISICEREALGLCAKKSQ